MAKRSEPSDVVVDFFSNAPPEAVRIVFPIVKGIVARRNLLTTRARSTKKERSARASPSSEDVAQR